NDFDPPIGVPVPIEPGLRRIVAPNPSPMTFRGTNTYLLGTTGLAVVDPGPDSLPHLKAILSAVEPAERITHIIVTHSHLDHSPLARPLAQATGAPILAFGGAEAGRSEAMDAFVKAGMSGGSEGIDHAFAPDTILSDGDEIGGDGWTLDVIHTPGHLGNHISLAWKDACLTGDHVMGWASSLVSPPDGDLTDFMASCAQLARHSWRVFYPGHGAPITDPNARLDWLIAHRMGREAAILSALEPGPARADEIAYTVYADTPAALLAAATRNVLAHLIDLTGKSKVRPLDPLTGNARFERIPPS
ncbi:MAG: MBL fold metallo-hydrolase, partial [Roseobacter sp.]